MPFLPTNQQRQSTEGTEKQQKKWRDEDATANALIQNVQIHTTHFH